MEYTIINYIIVGALLVMSALFSGLTLGLMGLDTHELKRKKSLGSKDAAKVYSVRRKGNLLLTTLLLGNVAVNSALAIFLGSIATGLVAGLIATALIVTIGEIIPQAIFSRHALSLGSRYVWLVKIFIFVCYPIAKPISWVLDMVLGEELNKIYSKHELMKIIEEHEDTDHSDLDADEERIIKGALTFSDKRVSDIMTSGESIMMISSDSIIDDRLVSKIKKENYSRIPVYQGDKDDVIGVFYYKQLLDNENFGKKVGEVARKKVYFVKEKMKLDSAFNMFLRTRHHLFIVRDNNDSVVGVISLEDVLEEIIGMNIMDEGDTHHDVKDIGVV